MMPQSPDNRVLASLEERPLRVLVLDDESAVRVLLKTLLGSEGMTVDAARDVKEARKLLWEESYDLLMLDQNLPDGTGVALLREARAKSINAPALFITAFPSSDVLTEAFDAGASDFITKPFLAITPLVSRIRLVAEQGLVARFYERVSADLAEAAASGGGASARFADALEDLKQAKEDIARRPSALILDPEPDAARSLEDLLRVDSLTVEGAGGSDEALARLKEPDGPLVLVVSLSCPDAIEVIRSARETDSLVDIVVTGDLGQLEEALEAVEAGAGDYCLRTEGPKVLARRVSRAVGRARRQRLQDAVLSRMHALARQIGEDTDPELSVEITEDTSPGLEGPDEGELVSRTLGSGVPSSISSARHLVNLPAVVSMETDDESERSGMVRNVSGTGFFIALDEPENPGEKVKVRIDASPLGLPEPICTTCEVVWSIRYARDLARESGMGLRLQGGQTGALEPLIEAVSRRPT